LFFFFTNFNGPGGGGALKSSAKLIYSNNLHVLSLKTSECPLDGFQDRDNILVTSHFGCNELLPPILEQAPPAQHLISNHHQRHSESV